MIITITLTVVLAVILAVYIWSLCKVASLTPQPDYDPCPVCGAGIGEPCDPALHA